MRNVIVTGGSRGLGLGTSRRLAKAGYRVIAIARNENCHLAEAIREAEAENPGSLCFRAFDLSRINEISELVKALRRDFGPIYGLVNNAAISYDGVLAMTPIAAIEDLIRVNTVSPIVFTKCVVRSMMSDGGGRIVNLSSVTALTGYAGLSVYGATKASMVGFTRSLAREVGKMGINVNAVAPGFIETDMTRGLNEEQLDKIKRRSALRRLPEIQDVANAIEFLLSDGAKNITGTVLTVDAGNSA